MSTASLIQLWVNLRAEEHGDVLDGQYDEGDDNEANCDDPCAIDLVI